MNGSSQLDGDEKCMHWKPLGRRDIIKKKRTEERDGEESDEWDECEECGRVIYMITFRAYMQLSWAFIAGSLCCCRVP